MRTVELFYPGGKFYSLNVEHSKDVSIYKSIEDFKKKSNPGFVNKEGDKISLYNIINLHNAEGIQSIERIRSMIKDIKLGKNILSNDGFPNIKLITKDNRWILFDGHHTMLAYMAMGKESLSEVPYIIVKNQDGEISDKEISVFFGEHSADWRENTINWQASKEEQVCKRKQKNMGELLESVKLEL